MNQQATHFEDLVWKYLDQDISEAEFAEFQELLAASAERRALYQNMVELHQGLQHQAKFDDPAAKNARIADFMPTPQAAAARRGGGWRWAAAIAASACVGLILYTVLNRSQPLDVEYIALREADIRGAKIQVGDRADTRMTHLMSGAVALYFKSQTQVVVEGPAFYQVQGNDSIMLSSGTITVHHEGAPGVFKVMTPLGELVDMGTKFGVTIGNGVTDSMVMTEVYEGEVIYKNSDQKPMRMRKGDGYAILGNNESQTVVTEVNGSAVKVFGTFSLSKSTQNLRRVANLALGKPVTASSYYSAPSNGEVFRPEALTDNRGADSGSPWDWSFWLAESGEGGSATIDLLKTYEISRVDLQNTRNRHHNDRGTEDFLIEVSTDGSHFKEVSKGSLSRIAEQSTDHYQFESFSFDRTPARYVRITAQTNPRSTAEFHGVGLNEVRVYE